MTKQLPLDGPLLHDALVPGDFISSVVDTSGGLLGNIKKLPRTFCYDSTSTDISGLYRPFKRCYFVLQIGDRFLAAQQQLVSAGNFLIKLSNVLLRCRHDGFLVLQQHLVLATRSYELVPECRGASNEVGKPFE